MKMLAWEGHTVIGYLRITYEAVLPVNRCTETARTIAVRLVRTCSLLARLNRFAVGSDELI